MKKYINTYIKLKLSQKGRVGGRKIFVKGDYLSLNDGVINFSDEEIGSFSKIFAFTLIELLVVSTIVIIMLTGGVLYFSYFLDSYSIKLELQDTRNYLDDLDYKVKNRELFDYKLHFKTNSLLLYNYQNIYDSYYSGSFNNIDMKIGTGVIFVKPSYSGSTASIKIYNSNRFLYENYINNNESLSYSFTLYREYLAQLFLNSIELNSIGLYYFSETNLNKSKGDFLELVSINTKEDKSGTGYIDLEITNIAGKKTIGVGLEEVYLFFDRGGKEENIKIINN